MTTPQITTNAAGVQRRTDVIYNAGRYAITPLDRQVWCYLRDQGGFHTWQEVCDVFNLPSSRNGPGPMSRLFNRGNLVRRRARSVNMKGTYDCWAYGVTATCLPIDGETLQPQGAPS